VLPNIVLVGFMGCGKSSVGKRLASITGHRFIDSDDLVVRAESRTIQEIFEKNGEEYFREVESRVVGELVGVAGIVLSTGGGVILAEQNRLSLREIGVVAWLDAAPDILFERASRSGRRPLLQTEDPHARFDALLAERLSIYQNLSDFRVDSTELSHEQAAAAILDQAIRNQRFT